MVKNPLNRFNGFLFEDPALHATFLRGLSPPTYRNLRVPNGNRLNGYPNQFEVGDHRAQARYE